MKMHIRFLVGACMAASALAATPASATIPVIDPSAIAKIRETVSVATKQLSSLQQQVSQVTQMRNTIGQVGPGMLGNILQQAGLDFSSAQGMLRDVTSLTSQIQSIPNQAKSLKLDGESMNFGNITNLASGREAASQLFFYNGSKPMSSELVTQLRQRRNVILRDSAISSYGAATSMKGDLAKSQQIADNLSSQAKNAADLRGDVQANTATMLAIYGEITKQTAIQAQLLEMQSAQTLAVDATGKRSN